MYIEFFSWRKTNIEVEKEQEKNKNKVENLSSMMPKEPIRHERFQNLFSYSLVARDKDTTLIGEIS